MSTSTTTERLQEYGFAGLLLLGVLVFALGLAFLILGTAIQTQAPAPYLASPTDRYGLIAGSVVAMVVGLVMVRAAGRVVGW